MAKNIEIKARVHDIAALAKRVASLATQRPTEIDQDDTFFRCLTGRLKLRTFSVDRGELIFYRRADQTGPRESFFLRSSTSEPDRLRECLSLAYERGGRVRKHRTLYLVGRTRVHLDEVEGLGSFVELEVVVADGEPVSAAIAEAQHLMRTLEIHPSQLVERAYVDLLLQNGSLSPEISVPTLPRDSVRPGAELATRLADDRSTPALLEVDPLLLADTDRRQLVWTAVERGDCVVATEADQILGYVVLRGDLLGHPFVPLLVVAEGHRRRGIAGRLLEEACLRCEGPKLFTSCNRSNIPVQRLFEKLGFESSGVIENLDDGDDELIYIKRLNQ